MLETIDEILITILSCRYIELYSYELGNGTCANNEDKDQLPQTLRVFHVCLQSVLLKFE